MIYFARSQEITITNRRAPRRIFLSLAACLFALGAPAATLTILHTSDLHGHVDPSDELSERDWGEGLARIATAVAAARAGGAPVLLLDSGDTIQGTPMQAIAFRAEGASDPTIRAMNAVGYSAMAVGNHEFDFGMKRLEASRREARFPWVSANIVREDGRPAFDPYVIRKVAGVRVGILGLTTRNVPSWEAPGNYAGLRFLDTVEAARKFVPILRDREKCDVVVVITHQGFERDLATGREDGTEAENQAWSIATGVPGIDLLLTGHTHTVIEPRKVGKTWVSQPGRFGNTLTRFDLVLAKNGARWELGEVSGRNLPMKEVVPDAAVARLVSAEHGAATRALAEPVASLAAPESVRNARTADNGALDWLHGVQKREGRADLSFASLLPGTLPDWPAGPLTVRQVWSFYPYENSLVTVRATGRQVRQALESAARCVSGIAVQNGQPVWKRNPSIWGFNCDTLDGADYALDPTRPEGRRLLFLRRNGKDVGDDEVFSVAINSYRAAGGGGYDVWRDCPRIATVGGAGRGVRDLLLEDARRIRTLRLAPNENWFLSPALPEGRLGASD